MFQNQCYSTKNRLELKTWLKFTILFSIPCFSNELFKARIIHKKFPKIIFRLGKSNINKAIWYFCFARICFTMNQINVCILDIKYSLTLLLYSGPYVWSAVNFQNIENMTFVDPQIDSGGLRRTWISSNPLVRKCI